MTHNWHINEFIFKPEEKWKGVARLRVEQGAKWLDEEVPQWEDRIDPEFLDMTDGGACICGQVFMDQMNNYTNGYGYFSRNHNTNEATGYGFLACDEFYHDLKEGETEATEVSNWEEYSFIAEEWLIQVDKRLANRGKLPAWEQWKKADQEQV